MKLILQKLKYANHNWINCGDLKVLYMLLGSQNGYTNIFVSYGTIVVPHWKQKIRRAIEDFRVGEKNIVQAPLVNQEKILFLPLHIKLGLMKQFVLSS